MLQFLPFFRKPLTRLGRDERGIATVEFAIIMIIILALLFGTVDAVFALTAKRKVSLATHSMADLISRETELSTGDSQAIASLARVIITPFPSDNAQITLTGGTVDNSGQNVAVAWSCAFTGDNPTASNTPAGTSLPLPSPLTQGTFLVIAETNLEYRTVLGHLEGLLNIGNLTLGDTSYFQSRSGNPIQLNGGC